MKFPARAWGSMSRAVAQSKVCSWSYHHRYLDLTPRSHRHLGTFYTTYQSLGWWKRENRKYWLNRQRHSTQLCGFWKHALHWKWKAILRHVNTYSSANPKILKRKGLGIKKSSRWKWQRRSVTQRKDAAFADWSGLDWPQKKKRRLVQRAFGL